MIRHIFIGTFKDNISEEIKQQELSDMKNMKHPYHVEYIAKTSEEYFDTTSFVSAQFEF